MILIDFSPILIGAINGYHKFNQTGTFDPVIFKTAIIRKIIRIKSQFRNYGDVVLCIDAKRHTYWRRDVFPHYKGAREASTAPSLVEVKFRDAAQQEEVNRIRYSIHHEIREHFPWKVVGVPKAEADDVIGVLTLLYSREQPILIVSRDGDFKQLQQYKGVKQYDVITSKWINSKNPALDLKEKIIRGDTGDGIPNIQSPGHTLMTKGLRQKPMITKKLNEWLYQEPTEFCTSEGMMDRWKENRKLIDLSQIPFDIVEDIVKDEASQTFGDKSKLNDYIVESGCIDLVDEYQNI